jgi:hemoglobin
MGLVDVWFVRVPWRELSALTANSEITEAELEALIPRFYDRVRNDALIGPIFNDGVDDWTSHLERLVAFWSSVMLTSGRYKGNPVAAHMKHLGAITPPMFDRWLALWAEVTDQFLPAPQASVLQAKATRIGESLKLAMFFRVPAPPGSQPAIAKSRKSD